MANRDATPTSVQVVHNEPASTGCLKWLLIIIALLVLSPFILFGGGCVAATGFALFGSEAEEEPAEDPGYGEEPNGR